MAIQERVPASDGNICHLRDIKLQVISTALHIELLQIQEHSGSAVSSQNL